jgi:hypothetical protein
VIAKLLEARPSFSNLFGLRLSPSKTSLTGQAPHSPLTHTHGSGGGLTPSRTSRQFDTVPESDQGERGVGLWTAASLPPAVHLRPQPTADKGLGLGKALLFVSTHCMPRTKVVASGQHTLLQVEAFFARS